jgi:hypothetical protein
MAENAAAHLVRIKALLDEFDLDEPDSELAAALNDLVQVIASEAYDAGYFDARTMFDTEG